jgi:hypothetical protein
MKKSIILFSIIALVVAGFFIFSSFTPSPTATKYYSFGYRASATLTEGTSVTIAPTNTMTIYTLSDTAGITINRSTTLAKNTVGDVLYFKLTGRGADTVTWGTGFTYSTKTAIANGKIKIASFYWTGTTFVPISTPVQIN